MWGLDRALAAQALALGCSPPCFCSKTLQRNRKMAMGRKKFNMDPKKVSGEDIQTQFDIPGSSSAKTIGFL